MPIANDWYRGAAKEIEIDCNMKDQLESLRNRLSGWLDDREIPEPAVILLTALLVGIGSGLGAVIFRRLIEGVHALAFVEFTSLLSASQTLSLLLIPAIGGAIVGPLIYKFAREAKGHGVPEVMEAVALHGGRIRPRVAFVKAIASSICIGTGGSVGREGPIAQIGSALGSTIGQFFKLSDERVRTLVACGAAGGVAATFNAPIAGSLFALEVILGQFNAGYFGAVVISAVTADVIAHIFEGDLRAFTIPQYSLISPWELVFYTLLGLIAAIAALGFTRLLYFSEDLWDTWRFPEYAKPILGGLLLGIIGIYSFQIDGFPRVFGVGYESITQALFGELTLRITLGLLFLKMLATVLTLGSGGSGGVFAPSLFMGAMLGEAFGQGINQVFPAITAPAGAYALVGMAAFFSGAAHAPVTAILILFEMTGDYQIILPLMLATVVSTLVARALSSESIYTLKLSRRGITLQQGKDIDVMQGILVHEAMTTDFDVVQANLSIAELTNKFLATYHHGFPVIDESGELTGVVTLQDLQRANARGDHEELAVKNIATVDGLLVAYPDEPMWKALKRLGARDIGRLPVVAGPESRSLVGILRRSDIIRAYNHAINKKAHLQHKAEVLKLGKLEKNEFLHLQIKPETIAIGKQIAQLRLPESCLILSVRRGSQVLIAHGNTALHSGDIVTIFADQACTPEIRELFSARIEDELLAQEDPKQETQD